MMVMALGDTLLIRKKGITRWFHYLFVSKAPTMKAIRPSTDYNLF